MQVPVRGELPGQGTGNKPAKAAKGKAKPVSEEWIPVTRGTIEGREGFNKPSHWFIQGHGPDAEAGAMSYAKASAQAAGGGKPKIIKGICAAQSSTSTPRANGDPIMMRWTCLIPDEL